LVHTVKKSNTLKQFQANIT